MIFAFEASNCPGAWIIVDSDLRESVARFKWRIDNRGYPVRSINAAYDQTKRTKITLHRFVMGAPPEGLVTDHINRNKLDNRRSNLRFTTESVNNSNKDWSAIAARRKNRFRDRSNASLGTRKRGLRWTAQIYFDRKCHHLGVFDSQEEASQAYWRAVDQRSALTKKGSSNG